MFFQEKKFNFPTLVNFQSGRTKIGKLHWILFCFWIWEVIVLFAMIIFHSVSKYFAVLGVHLSPLNNPRNGKLWFVLCLFGSAISCECIYIRYEARTIEEYSITSYAAFTIFALGFQLLNHVFTLNKFSIYINKFEDLVRRSKQFFFYFKRDTLNTTWNTKAHCYVLQDLKTRFPKQFTWSPITN